MRSASPSLVLARVCSRFARSGLTSAAFVAINNEASSWTNTFSDTTLPAGRYCNAIAGRVVDGKCGDADRITVSASGSFTATIGPYNALALSVAGLAA